MDLNARRRVSWWWSGWRRAAAVVGLCLAGIASAPAGTVLGPWVPVFRGIDHAVGTNTVGTTGFLNLQVVHFMRVDLTDPDIRFLASPPVTNFIAGYYETGGYTMTNYVKKFGVQVAINANGFYLPGSASIPSYTLAEGTVFNASGLLISEGKVVSPQDISTDVAVLMFATNNTPTFVPTNWPAVSTAGMFTAVCGPYAILVNGVNVGSNYFGSTADPHGIEPRTAMGLSKDRRYLFLLTIDGRQDYYSEGAYDWETAAWLLRAGAWDGVNMDGGGSTCLAMMDSTGHAVPVNIDNASKANNRERTVGAHFGVFAKPLPSFFTNVVALPDDTAATVTWSTLQPSTTLLKYGLTTNLTLTAGSNATVVSDHAVLLTNLSPDTEYYFATYATVGTTQYVSTNFAFFTTNYVVKAPLLELTNPWTYTTANLNGINWTARTYDDSAWSGPSPGAFWVDTRGMNANIPISLNTEMPWDASTGYPFRTYYLRTHFTLTNNPTGVGLQFETYLDDGAVFYLNGVEIYRLFLPAAPATISNTNLANGYLCSSSGDATCSTNFSLSGSIISTNLVQGDNVLAVEMHNYSARSPDITFGLSATHTIPYVLSPTLGLGYSNRVATLKWSRGGFTLEQAASPTGTWSNVPGPVFSSPFTTTNSGDTRFFRLKK